MGFELQCRARIGRSVHEGKALLETDELLFRGAEPGTRVKIPLTSIRSVSAANGSLRVDHADGRLVLDLGTSAEKWAERIKSPKSLIDKLEVKPTSVVAVVGIADEDFLEQLAARASVVKTGKVTKDADIIFLAVESARDLPKIANVAAVMRSNATLWVIHPKGPAGVKDTAIYAAAKPAGLTYTKVARFSPTHTAEKLVVPVAKR